MKSLLGRRIEKQKSQRRTTTRPTITNKHAMSLTILKDSCESWSSIHAPNGAEDYGQGWKKLFGSITENGVCIQQHFFRSSRDAQWRRRNLGQTLELCLNFSGSATIKHQAKLQPLPPRSLCFYSAGEAAPEFFRKKGTHSFLTLNFTRDYLRHTAEHHQVPLNPLINRWLQSPAFHFVGPVDAMSHHEEEAGGSLQFPKVSQNGLEIWYHAKLLELISSRFFAATPNSNAFPSMAMERQLDNRVEQVASLIYENLDNPLSLEEMARQVGCSTCYLSYLFSKSKGISISAFIKGARVEKAAEMIRRGTHNVSQAAYTVGYSSLSHFNKSFTDVMGIGPADFKRKTSSLKEFYPRQAA
jgi:AraC-like DNA-binding protein